MPNHLRRIVAPVVALAAGTALALSALVPAFADGPFTVGDFTYLANSDGTTATLEGPSGPLTSADIPGSIEAPGGKTFTVTDIADSAFDGLALNSITIPNTVKTIGAYAFDGNDSLTSISIPDSVGSIGVGAFEQDNNVTSLILGDGLQQIHDYAFYDLDVAAVTIPPSVVGIGLYAFDDDYGTLTTVTFSGAAPLTIGTASDYSPFGPAATVTVYYYKEFATPGGFTTPTWDGYQAQQLATGSPSGPSPKPSMPSDDSLYAVSCQNDEDAQGQLFSVDSATGISSPIGQASADALCGYGAVWDAQSSTAYVGNGEGFSARATGTDPIETINPQTGAIAYGFQPTLGGTAVSVNSLTITRAGDMYATYEPVTNGPFDLYSVDMGTGVMKLICSTGSSQYVAVGSDPTTGTLYGISADGSSLYEFDPVSATVRILTNSLGLYLPTNFTVEALQVDSSGQMWVEGDDSSETTGEVWVISPTSFAVTPEWKFSQDGQAFDSWSLMIVPKSRLATTGVSVSPVTVPLALLALSAGASLVIVSRIRARRRRRQV